MFELVAAGCLQFHCGGKAKGFSLLTALRRPLLGRLSVTVALTWPTQYGPNGLATVELIALSACFTPPGCIPCLHRHVEGPEPL